MAKKEVWSDKEGCSLTVDEYAFIGVYALARWHQRNLDISEQALLHDLGKLFLVYTTLVQAGKASFDVPTK